MRLFKRFQIWVPESQNEALKVSKRQHRQARYAKLVPA
jgi:hypothetical protein